MFWYISFENFLFFLGMLLAPSFVWMLLVAVTQEESTWLAVTPQLALILNFSAYPYSHFLDVFLVQEDWSLAASQWKQWRSLSFSFYLSWKQPDKIQFLQFGELLNKAEIINNFKQENF